MIAIARTAYFSKFELTLDHRLIWIGPWDTPLLFSQKTKTEKIEKLLPVITILSSSLPLFFMLANHRSLCLVFY